MATEPDGQGAAEVVDGGHWENGVWHSPEGWPEGAGWIVRNADGSIAQWGPASDLALVAMTDVGHGEPLPPAENLSAELKGILTPGEGDG